MGLGWNAQYEEFGSTKKAPSEPVDDLSSPESIQDHEKPPLRQIDKYIRAECPCLSKRATVALLSCIGFIIMFGMRTSMGIIKLKIEKNSNVSKGVLSAEDSAIFWGYFVTQIPGGLIAAAYPANKLFGAAIGCSSCLNFIIPLVYTDYPRIFIMIRVMQGLVEGVTYPACHGILRYWAPPLERSRLATLAFTGCYAGVMFAMPITGFLTERVGVFSPFIFYACLGLVWYASWLWLVFEKPCYHPAIETRELNYIETSLGNANLTNYPAPSITNTPWKSFFTSLPCYAIFVANFCRSWNFYLLVMFQPKYFAQVFAKKNIEKTSYAGAVPHLLMTIIVPTGGILADKIRKKGLLTTTQVRKLFNCGGFGMEATFFILMAYSENFLQAITALSIGVAFSGFAISGFNVNHLDIAPRYASILMGMSNGIGTIAGCICPFVVNLINTKGSESEWRIVFVLSACIHYAGVIFYAIFASGELQDWADPQFEEEKQWNQMNETGQIKPSPSGQNNGLLRRQASTKTNYGSVDAPLPPRPPPPVAQSSQEKPQPPPSAPFVPSGNPFLTNSNPFRQEQVQPEAQDTYLHGTIADRTY